MAELVKKEYMQHRKQQQTVCEKKYHGRKDGKMKNFYTEIDGITMTFNVLASVWMITSCS